ncbi:MAG TPA: two-component regulator propeller domain-containing protein [Tenuifilum sp.]|uniref:two-component regulator propeller domain-containing protein n=4 Tax=Tenuifilum sp. TaxID=2760880 RepID=UPI001B77D4F3|nr:SpoIIE family protein phosphatase [Bacteroidales bacterium]HOK60991.1 two-component regulator propeller domain-containing protein [Tenuifilum sp.]MBP9028774.1 SpoIIE family protein phosphatase [Bacteroidales bacterium]HOK85652.1 two-component regulator propeller domain-containing protein [Tenuifilum sp.]HON70371.1 two-component regulator propeller domain-containing protein [Tenuifilum sp.]
MGLFRTDKKLLPSCVAALLLAATSSVFAQRVNVTLFNSDNGLPQSFVNALLQDSLGFLWIGTQDGLCRYDGYDFVVFNNNPYDSLSLSNNYVNHLVEGVNGELWIATRSGLNRVNRKTGKVKVYYNHANNPRSLSSNMILRVYRDRSNRIWVKTIDALHLYNPTTDDFTRFPHFNDIFNISQTSDLSPIFENSNERLWVGTKDGLFYFDKERLVFKRYSEDPANPNSIWGNRVNAITEGLSGKLLIGTDKGINEFDFLTQKFRRVILTLNDPSNKSLTTGIQFLGYDNDSSLWVGSVGGLGKLLPNGTFIKYNSIYSNNLPVNILNVSTVLRDRTGVLWIGSQTGLVKVNPFEHRIGGYSKDPNGRNLFSNNVAASVIESTDGNIWVGTWGSGLHIFNPTTGENRHYWSGGGNYIPNDFIHSLYQTRDGRVLVGTRNGVFQYLPSSRQFVDFFERNNVYVGDLFKNNRVYSITEDLQDRVWFATRQGLHCLKGGNLISFYARRGDSLSLPGNEVYDVVADKNANVWVATISGLCRISADLRTIETFSFIGNKSRLPFEVLCLYIAKNETVWVGTTSGLFWINPKGKNVLHSVVLPDINIRLINDILEDDRGRFWISTNKGLVLYNPLSNLVKVFNNSDGLFSNELNINASFKNSKGRMYFGSIDGVNVFHPDSIPTNKVVPNVCITHIQVYSKSGNTEIIPYQLKFLRIPDDFSNLTFTIAALDFVQPNKNSYRYQLVGHDSRWVELGNTNKITFSNLSEGDYELRIMGSNSDQVWTTEYKSLRIRAVAPWWRSRIAKWIYGVIVLISLLVWAIRRNKHLREINRLLHERETVLEELRLQKDELAFKNKNITDSINYAKRIQESMLPSISRFKEFVPESFVIFKPKDIVSGDFYWVNETRNKTFIAVVDCTGHGVPGAFMSIIGIELLRNITNVEGVDDAAEILNRLSVAIHNTFATSSFDSAEGVKVKDGMDVSFCVIDKEYNMLQFAGAFSNLFLVRDGKLMEIKGDRYSVGMANELGHSQFSSYYIPIQPNDTIYMFTDGIVDQFGGPEGKKFKYRRFRHLLLSNYMKPIELQRTNIEKAINDWMGNLEQVDDMLIIGIKPELSCMF